MGLCLAGKASQMTFRPSRVTTPQLLSDKEVISPFKSCDISYLNMLCVFCSFQGALHGAGGGPALDAGKRSCVQVPHPRRRAGVRQRCVLGERHRFHRPR